MSSITTLTDRAAGHAVRTGILVGIPATFLIVVAMTITIVDLKTAVAIAIWPALVAGPYAGGLALLLSAGDNDRRVAEVTTLPLADAGTDDHVADARRAA